MTPFVPDAFISITSNGGNIGRFFWANKASYMLELWGTDGFTSPTLMTFQVTALLLALKIIGIAG